MDTCSLISPSSGSAASSGLPLLCELAPRARAAGWQSVYAACELMGPELAQLWKHSHCPAIGVAAGAQS